MLRPDMATFRIFKFDAVREWCLYQTGGNIYIVCNFGGVEPHLPIQTPSRATTKEYLFQIYMHVKLLKRCATATASGTLNQSLEVNC